MANSIEHVVPTVVKIEKHVVPTVVKIEKEALPKYA